MANDKIVVAGVPRFDFYSTPLKSILLTKAEFLGKYGLDSRYPLVTFATNFTQASFHTSNRDFYLHNAKKYGRDKVLEEAYGDLGDVPRRDYISRELFLDAFVTLVRNLPKVNFALKLHPTEDHQFYKDLIRRDLCSSASRVRMIAREYIWDVLNATDIELNRSCTTAIESWLLGKPTIEMQLNPDEYYFSPEFASGSDSDIARLSPLRRCPAILQELQFLKTFRRRGADFFGSGAMPRMARQQGQWQTTFIISLTIATATGAPIVTCPQTGNAGSTIIS